MASRPTMLLSEAFAAIGFKAPRLEVTLYLAPTGHG